MSDYNRKNNSSSRSNGGGRSGGGSRRGGRKGGGGNTGFTDSPSSNNHSNSPYKYGEPPRMRVQTKNKWDDHAREHEEEELIKKGLLPPRNQRSPIYDRQPNDYPHESYTDGYADDHNDTAYDRHNGYDNGYHYEDGRGQEYPSSYSPIPPRRNNELDYDLTPPRSNRSYDERRDDDYRNGDYHTVEYRNDDYRNHRSIEPPIRTLADEYRGWSKLDLDRELSRLQRRIDVVRAMREDADCEDVHYETGRNYSPYSEEREFIENVREGESFYERDDRGERDEAGFSPLGRQAYETQQRRNNQDRGYIPAGGLDRYGPSSRRDNYRSDGGRGRDEERRDEDQRGERRDNHYNSSNGYRSSTGNSEGETRESMKGKKKRNKNRKHRGSTTYSTLSNSTFDSDDCSSESLKRHRSSGYSSSASQTLRSSTIHEHASHSNHSLHHYRIPSQSIERQMMPTYEERQIDAPSHSSYSAHPSSSLPPSLPPLPPSLPSSLPSSSFQCAPPDVLTPAKIVEMAAAASTQRSETSFSPSADYEEMTGDRGGPGRGGYGGGERGRGDGGGGDRGRGGYRGGGGGEYRGRGRGGGTNQISTGFQSMNLGVEPEPLPFRDIAPGEQEGYKAAAKPAPALREGKQKVHVISNVWQLEYEDRLVYRYDVSVGLEAIGNDGSSRTFSVNKGPKDDASVHERNELIREALKRGLEMYNILSRNGCIGVDGAAMMYANEDLAPALKPRDYKITVPVESLSEDVRKFIRNAGVKNVVIEVVASKNFRIKDLSGQTSIDRSEMDQSVKQFFEVITSEHALSSHNYSFFTGGNLYRDDPDRLIMGGGNKFAQPIGSGQERRDGMSKGFTLAEKNGNIIGALNIDVTTGTFWTEQRLLYTILEINGWKHVRDVNWNARTIKRTNDLIKNLRVSYTPPCTEKEGDSSFSFDFIANGITASTWSDEKGGTKVNIRTMEDLTCKNANGKDEPLYNKFSNSGLNRDYRSWPLIESKRARRRTDDPTKYDVNTEYFPIELLNVKANQRVPLKKQGADPAKAMPVEDRWKGTNQALDALNLFGDTRSIRRNPVMDAFGIRVSRRPLETTGITRRMPNVTFNREADVDVKTSFRTGQLQFHTPAHITTLIIAISDNQHRFDQRGFATALLESAKKKLMKIDSHIIEICHPNKMHDRMKKIHDDRKAGDAKLRRVVFMYIEPEASKRHDELKLFERRFSVVTQHLTMEIACNMARNRPTMENVLLKLNVKGGGHNYNVNPEKFAMNLWMGKKTMIMGYDVWHPTGQSRAEKMADSLPEPSVVGFSFNGGVNADSFIGDYHFQQATKERVNDDVLNARIKWMLSVFEKTRGELPPLIIVIRDGISDGQYKHGMDELEALREGVREHVVSKARTDITGKPPKPDYEPKFIFVVATKRHHKRMYTEDGRGKHANMPAMSVVDDTITNPSLFEFFLQSHTPLQGMAKATKYTVLKDDIGTTSDAMQSLMGALCFEHQVSTNAISIPEPVYQSDEWAKRGAANMRKFREVYGEKGQFKPGFTYDDLTTRLSYWKSDLAQVRVNA